MDSFVLAETFKYLYLLFAEDSDLNLDISNFVFTTEGHLLPLSLARLSNRTAVPVRGFSFRLPLYPTLTLRCQASIKYHFTLTLKLKLIFITSS